MKQIRFLGNRMLLTTIAFAAGTSFAFALLADVSADADRPLRYVVVLKADARGDGPEVGPFGGRELSRWGNRRMVEIPQEAIEALSRHAGVAYLALVNDGVETDAPRYVRGQVPESLMRIRTDTEPDYGWDSGIYTYDGAGNITAIGSNTFRYDKAHRLARATVNGETIDYTYDSFGNQTQRKIGTAIVGTPASLRSNQLADATYDRAGNQLSDISDAQSYRYDGANMMVERKALSPRRYIYTADDERIGESVGGSEWRWTIRDFSGRPLSTFGSWDMSELTFWEWQESHHYQGSTLTSAIKLQERLGNAGNSRYFHVDHLGSPRLITNQSRQKISLHDYHPFGKEQTAHNQEITDWQYDTVERMKFTGHERDFTASVDSNLHDYLDYMHGRYYNPSWGRFLSVDPAMDLEKIVHEPQLWNRYSYVGNSPINFTDPDGRERSPCSGFAQSGGCAPQPWRGLNNELRGDLGQAALAFGGALFGGSLIKSAWQLAVGFVLGNPQGARQLADAALSPTGSSTMPVPTLSGSVREMAGEAISFTAAMKGSAAQKVEAFAQLAGQIEKASGGAWSATQVAGSKGSTVFFGRAGEALVIAANGQVFRGKLNEGIKVVNGVAEVAWDKVKLVR